jgi:(p)ppGpp synthase/HD superfamily hydrolase
LNTYLIEKAEQYARDHHKGQTRKGEAAEPYISHVSEVASLVRRFGGDDISIAGAWLHDVVEDCTPTIDDIFSEFGDEVAVLVAEVTDDKTLEKAERKARQVATAAKKSDRACLIKWADKTSNLRAIALSPPPWPEARKHEYVAWASTVTNVLPLRPDNAVALFEEAKGLALASI